MEETVQKEEGISLVQIFHLLLSKIKLLILVTLIGGILGVGFAYLQTHDVHYYGTEVQFYVNPDNPKDTEEGSQFGVYGAYGVHVMDNMVKLLSSESFTEFLILNGKTVPDKADSFPQELKTAIDNANTVNSTADATVAEKAEANEAALVLWRKTTEYKTQLAEYSGKIKYSYLGETENKENANDLARSFIYVEISVLNKEDLAIDLHERVITIVPAFVEKHMAIPNGYESTNCQRITRSDEVHLLNDGYTVTQCVKFGALFALAALVIACIIVIVSDRSDKRLRDQETIVRLFNVPVLGIVPTIEVIATVNDKKKKEHTEVK